jgi:hypothetical protein
MSRCSKFVAIAALLLSGCGTTPEAAKEGSPAPAAASEDALTAEIQSKGAREVLARLNSGGQESAAWKDLIDSVSSGDESRIRVAVQLLQASDAANTEALLFALSKAITTNPTPVLESLGPDLTVRQVCIARQIEPTPEEMKAHIEAAKAALAKVDQASLASAKEDCLRELSR